MGLKLSFELSNRDLLYFREALRQSRAAVRDAEETEIVDAVRHVLEEIRDNEPLPDFVAERLPQLDLLIEMLADDEWQLPTDDRERLLAMFVYFSDPEDILPDHIPVIGYLDDVIIIEIVTREMLHVREAYDDFRTFRRDFDAEHGKNIDGAIRRDRIDRQRQKLHQRMAQLSKSGTKFEIW
jgi:uncharacterized membrane protein YkvA (DUF1232 family)